jgi:hypothetical protein
MHGMIHEHKEPDSFNLPGKGSGQFTPIYTIYLRSILTHIIPNYCGVLQQSGSPTQSNPTQPNPTQPNPTQPNPT